MRKAWMLLFLGVWVIILPYLGFPYSWKNTLFALSGLGIIYFSYILYQEHKKKEKVFDNFTENHDFEERGNKPVAEENKTEAMTENTNLNQEKIEN